MKILHLLNIHPRFTDKLVDMYDENFNNGEHEICYITKNSISNIRSDINLKQYEIYPMPLKDFSFKKIKEIADLFNKYDFIMMHGFDLDEFSTSLFYGIYLMMGKKLLNKLVWIEWGVDLYDFKQEGSDLKSFVNYHLVKHIKNNVRMFVGIFPPDCDVFREKYPNSKAEIMYAPYITKKKRKTTFGYNYESNLEKTNANNDTIYIQVGHNAQDQLNHIDALNKLSKFKNENIKIVLPLSYSNRNGYAEKVEEYAKKVFNDKLVVLKDFLSEEDYYKIVNRIDIAVFNTYRQTALGNIHNMIMRNVKLFMPKESVMYKYFTGTDIPIQAIDEIENMSFEEFVSIIDYSKYKGPKELIDWLNDFDRRLSKWNEIYNKLGEMCER